MRTAVREITCDAEDSSREKADKTQAVHAGIQQTLSVAAWEGLAKAQANSTAMVITIVFMGTRILGLALFGNNQKRKAGQGS